MSTPSGRRKVEKLLNENPHLSTQDIEQKLHGSDTKLASQTIKNYASNWRQYSRNGAVPRLHSGFGQLESGFDAGLWEVALSFEHWHVSKNKNRERLWFENGITVGWHRSGTVVFRFKGSRPRGHILGVFSHAFWQVLLSTGRSERELSDFLKALFEEKYRETHHYVFETERPQPKMKIDHFENRYGLTIKLGDGSHPTSLEVEEKEPPWLSRFEGAVGSFGYNIRTHMKVLKSIAKGVRSDKEIKKRILEALERQEAISYPLDPCARCRKRILHGYEGTQNGLFPRCDGQSAHMYSLLEDLLFRVVTVQSSSARISGQLVAFSEPQRGRRHRPCVLILETGLGLCLVRDWAVIAFDRGL